VMDLVDLRSQNNEKSSLTGIMLDITKEKEEELVRRELEYKYRFLTENTSDIIAVQDTSLEYTFISESIQKVLGYEYHQLVGKKERIITHKDDHFILNQIENFSKEGSNEMLFEYRLAHKDGEILWFRVTKKIFANEAHGTHQILSTYTDITKRKKAELELIENERQYRFLAENTSDAVALFDPNWNITYISPGVEQIFGYTLEEYLHLDPFEQVFPEDLPIIQQVVSDMQNGIDEFTREYRMFNKSREIIWVETKTQVIRTDNEIASVITTTNDITPRKTAELQRRKAFEQLQLAIGSANIGIWNFDVATKHLEVNDNLLEMYDLPAKSFDGSRRSLITKIHSEDIPLIRKSFNRMSEGETVSDLRLRIKRKDGTGHVVMSGVPLRNEKGEIISTVGINLDVTDIIDRKNLLRRKIEQLQIAAHTAKIGMFAKNIESENLEFNDEILSIYEVDRMEVLKDQHFWEKLVMPEDRLRALDGLNNVLSAKNPKNEERFRIQTKSGKIKHIYAAASLSDGKSGPKEVIGVNMDITDLIENEKKLAKTLEEKEMLLRELHHRVKNNLQMVSSILHIKSRKFKDSEVLNILKDVNSKIVSVAQVHESLLEQDSTSRILIDKYIHVLINNIVASFSGGGRTFDCKINVRPYKLESELVFTLGLMIHEIVMNIIKYAYDKDETNTIFLYGIWFL
ncbi:MAG: PAS domain S-box protein, partial [Ekhidna sp.]|nr:PAS domain S-box protein [Ekhidna sp.]